jgi:Sulfotransferase family
MPREVSQIAAGSGPNPFVFIVGCPKSATSLLQRVLNAHSLLAVTPEVEWITDYYKMRTGLVPEGPVTPNLVSKWIERKLFEPFELCRDDVAGLVPPGQTIPYERFLTALLDLYGSAQGKHLAGSKMPAYTRHLADLHAVWPRTKFIHLIRDGRDVCLSLLDTSPGPGTVERYPTWAEDRVSTAALYWERQVRRGRAGGAALGAGLYHELRYEELVARPEEACARLCAFLGLPYEPGMLRFHEGRTRAAPGLDAKNAWRPITPGLRDWRAQLPAGDVERFEAVAGDLLDELGYARACPRPSAAARAHADRLRAAFAEDIQSRQHLLPQSSSVS